MNNDKNEDVDKYIHDMEDLLYSMAALVDTSKHFVSSVGIMNKNGEISLTDLDKTAIDTWLNSYKILTAKVNIWNSSPTFH